MEHKILEANYGEIRIQKKALCKTWNTSFYSKY